MKKDIVTTLSYFIDYLNWLTMLRINIKYIHILDLLNIGDETDVDIAIENGALVVRACNAIDNKSKRAKEIEEIAKQVMEQYDEVFRKLAKT